MPVSGMRRVTPPTMMNAWSTMIEVRPAPISELTSDFARAEKEGVDADGSVVRELMNKYTWANVAGALDQAISADELVKNGDRT